MEPIKEKKELEINTTKRLISFGSCYGITLNTKMLEAKGYKLGDFVSVNIKPFISQTQKNNIFSEVAKDIMEESKKPLLIKMAKKPEEPQNEAQ